MCPYNINTPLITLAEQQICISMPRDGQIFMINRNLPRKSIRIHKVPLARLGQQSHCFFFFPKCVFITKKKEAEVPTKQHFLKFKIQRKSLIFIMQEASQTKI